jgi:hypothetical protein
MLWLEWLLLLVLLISLAIYLDWVWLLELAIPTWVAGLILALSQGWFWFLVEGFWIVFIVGPLVVIATLGTSIHYDRKRRSRRALKTLTMPAK